MQSKAIKKIIRELSIEFKMKDEDIEDIIRAPFFTVAETIKTSDRDTVTFPSIRISGLGLFYCTDGRKEFYRKLNLKNKEDGREEEPTSK